MNLLFFTALLLPSGAHTTGKLALTPDQSDGGTSRLAWGGAEAQAEMVSMVGEKVVAAMEAANTLMTGGSHDQVIARYRELVADNTRRLTA
ncbi:MULTISPECIES: hypothetical protein [Methylobacteriaceae]|uniref:Uncharacterized protein n=2 Tax=Methylorubrum extorquens TaxID=408 RepID=C7CFK5_METED|nr:MULTISPECIES: hypothetical protein [Methylobacteriaceae]AWV19921.1 hypothetical protein A3862_30315 [Methylobacterium sp. XJLW]AYO86581.1 hypothetical protein EBB05_30005 [Methylobacterium brachiatum]CAX26139.1 protein of unknown function [Methylorubrum extorquens DM4]